jgi:hypothetical protein
MYEEDKDRYHYTPGKPPNYALGTLEIVKTNYDGTYRTITINPKDCIKVISPKGDGLKIYTVHSFTTTHWGVFIMNYVPGCIGTELSKLSREEYDKTITKPLHDKEFFYILGIIKSNDINDNMGQRNELLHQDGRGVAGKGCRRRSRRHRSKRRRTKRTRRHK